jgi:hypothetical protein
LRQSVELALKVKNRRQLMISYEQLANNYSEKLKSNSSKQPGLLTSLRFVRILREKQVFIQNFVV